MKNLVYSGLYQAHHQQQQQQLILLNSPISKDDPIFDLFWHSSSYKVCADGGANRLYDHDGTLLPDQIVGDLDSLTTRNKKYYESKGVTIQKLYDQDRHDLDKALDVLDDDTDTAIIVYGAFGGRLDQEMANLNVLYKSPTKIFLYNHETMAFLLPQGHHELVLHRAWEGPSCGLIPLGGCVESISTTGLQYNMSNHRMEFNGLVSSSNRLIDATDDDMGWTCTVETSHPVLFTAQVSGGGDPGSDNS